MIQNKIDYYDGNIIVLYKMSTLLEQKNPHVRDTNITFEPIAHKYTILDNGTTTVPYISVTTWLHTHFAEFNPDAIITGMMASPKWSLSAYYGKTREEIKMEWNQKRDEAAAAGTALHYAIECFYNGTCETSITSTEYNYFMNFVKTHTHLKPYRTEWMIYDDDVKIAGSIDMVFEDLNEEGSFAIYDWKRVKEIKKTDGFNKYSTTECINHLPDTNFWHYALQLNIYKAILQRKYGKKITSLVLVCLHPNNKNGDYLLYKVPDLTIEIADLFELRRQQINKIK